MSVKTQTTDTPTCFVACATGLEKLLHRELRSLGIKRLRIRRAGVDCEAELRDIYRICLWSRIANRLLYPLTAFKVSDEKNYYSQLLQLDWSEHLSETGTLAVDFYSSDSCITHSQYGAQLTKDAVVDWFREKTGTRPNVDRDKPDVRINVYLYKNRARVSLDMAGTSLHRRNYRQQGGMAPLKENLAAAILYSALWPDYAKRGSAIHDPMCGSGTLLIEAAMMAGNMAPGINRDYFGFFGWRHHQAELWQEVLQEARSAIDLDKVPPVRGTEIDRKSVAIARENIAACGLENVVKVDCEDFFETSAPLSHGPGLVIVNPPYGERLEKNSEIGVFYTRLGRNLRRYAGNWHLALFTGNSALFHRTGLSRRVVLECANGGIDCRLFLTDIPPAPITESLQPEAEVAPLKASEQPNPWHQATQQREQRQSTKTSAVAPGLNQFRDRLRKNLRQLSGWAKSAGITNYRVYDADLPDYAFALDVYYGVADDSTMVPYVCLQEYKAPAHIDQVLAQRRIDGAASVVIEELQCDLSNLSIKRREKQRAESQYMRLDKRNQSHEVVEGESRFLINIHDYLDSGLFLDHRKVRQWLGKNSAGKRFLNLYCYTASATVHAVNGGAPESISVDLSQKYLEWADKNFALNGIDKASHQLVHADCRQWVEDAVKAGKEKFDIIFLDPPTFSNSTSMDGDWEVQRDHISMIDGCMSILRPEGILVFSNNYRRFKLAESVMEKYHVQDRTKWSLQRDFARNQRIHQCWFVQVKDR